ncbi:AlbA family DNA-binding domain-containing protein [Streptomyces sp. NPDC004980]
MLRRDDQWLDWRHFPAPTYGRARDASVVWEQPSPELDLLLANGEGTHLECKREVPEGDSRKKMLKTIAAFASQDGGTVLIGVQDDLQIVGLPEKPAVDKQVLQVIGMIRDTLEPVPPYEPRVIGYDGKAVLAIEVSGGARCTPTVTVTHSARSSTFASARTRCQHATMRSLPDFGRLQPSPRSESRRTGDGTRRATRLSARTGPWLRPTFRHDGDGEDDPVTGPLHKLGVRYPRQEGALLVVKELPAVPDGREAEHGIEEDPVAAVTGEEMVGAGHEGGSLVGALADQFKPSAVMLRADCVVTAGGVGRRPNADTPPAEVTPGVTYLFQTMVQTADFFLITHVRARNDWA